MKRGVYIMKSHSISHLNIGPLIGGGLVLGYRCGSRCQHCLYGCGPHRRDGETVDNMSLDPLLDQLAERAPYAQFHIGSGESFLNLGLLEKAVAGLNNRGLILDYVETNASWFRTDEQAESVLQQLANLGLECILVSLSPFQAEFVPTLSK